MDKDNMTSTITFADKGEQTHVDIACDSELVKLALGLTNLPVKIENYDSFYEMT